MCHFGTQLLHSNFEDMFVFYLSYFFKVNNLLMIVPNQSQFFTFSYIAFSIGKKSLILMLVSLLWELFMNFFMEPQNNS